MEGPRLDSSNFGRLKQAATAIVKPQLVWRGGTVSGSQKANTARNDGVIASNQDRGNRRRQQANSTGALYMNRWSLAGILYDKRDLNWMIRFQGFSQNKSFGNEVSTLSGMDALSGRIPQASTYTTIDYADNEQTKLEALIASPRCAGSEFHFGNICICIGCFYTLDSGGTAWTGDGLLVLACFLVVHSTIQLSKNISVARQWRSK